jgi:hypothetical protein
MVTREQRKKESWQLNERKHVKKRTLQLNYERKLMLPLSLLLLKPKLMLKLKYRQSELLKKRLMRRLLQKRK